jgi:hypothetical protein
LCTCSIIFEAPPLLFYTLHGSLSSWGMKSRMGRTVPSPKKENGTLI